MGCAPNISIALSLLAFTAGVWLLYKTQKEMLGRLFKIAAWFVIVVALLNMACCGIRSMHGGCYGGSHGMHNMHGGGGSCGMSSSCGMSGSCPMMSQGCGQMMGHHGMCMQGGGSCGMQNMNACHGMMEGSCSKMGNCNMGHECMGGGMNCSKGGEMNCMKGGEECPMMKKDSTAKK